MGSNFGYQNKMTKNLFYGALWSIFKTNMDTVKGKGSNVDIGLYWKLKKVDLSLAMKNIIKTKGVNYRDTEEGDNSSDGEKEYLPLEFIMGVNYKVWDLNLLGQVNKVKEGKLLKNTGVSYQPSFFKHLRLSVGQREVLLVRYKALIEEEVVISVQSIGVGLNVKKIHFDYAYEYTDHVNKADSNRHYFSIALNY